MRCRARSAALVFLKLHLFNLKVFFLPHCYCCAEGGLVGACSVFEQAGVTEHKLTFTKMFGISKTERCFRILQLHCNVQDF